MQKDSVNIAIWLLMGKMVYRIGRGGGWGDVYPLG